MNDLMTIPEMKEVATALVKSQLFGLPTAEAALTLMLLCQAEGLHPMQAVKRYHIIKGRPAMRADAMLAEFQRQGGRVEWQDRTDEKVSAYFSHDASGKCLFSWTIEMAKRAGLTDNPTWKKFPRQMLTARVISEACRTMLPGVVCGIYTPEEIQDFDEQPKTKKQPRGSAENTPEDIMPVAVLENATTGTESPAITLAEKVTGENKPEPEFVPGEITPEPVPEVKPAARPSKDKSAGEIAAEIKQIRSLAQKYGCKTVADFAQCMQVAAGRAVDAATELSDDERARAIEFLTEAVKEA